MHATLQIIAHFLTYQISRSDVYVWACQYRHTRSQWDRHLGVAPHTQVPVPLTTLDAITKEFYRSH